MSWRRAYDAKRRTGRPHDWVTRGATQKTKTEDAKWAADPKGYVWAERKRKPEKKLKVWTPPPFQAKAEPSSDPRSASRDW